MRRVATGRVLSAVLSIFGVCSLGCGEDPQRADSECVVNSASCNTSTGSGTEADAGDGVRSNDHPGGGGGDGDGDGSGGPAYGVGIPCDAWNVISNNCLLCHSSPTRYGAPMSLASFADFQAAAPSDASRKVYEVAHTRVNATDANVRMPPASHDPLSSADLATLNAWFEAGAPKDDTSCGSGMGGDGDGDGNVDEPIDTTGLECFRFLAHAEGDKNAPYPVGTASDRYMNFSFVAPWTTDVYSAVVRPIIQNDKVVHHWLLFEDDAPGTDGDVSTSSGAHPSGQLVFGWAPGGQAFDFRRWGDVAFEFKKGTGYTLELHYNSKDANATDASGVELCMQKKKPANIAGLSWLGTDAIAGTSASGTCKPSSNEPIRILGITPHMHTTGKHMKATIQRAGGAVETLHDAPFDFNYQTMYPADVTLMPGDSITTTCEYSQFATFGESTGSEMCYLFTIAYPKGALADGGLWGTFAHGGSPCLGI